MMSYPEFKQKLIHDITRIMSEKDQNIQVSEQIKERQNGLIADIIQIKYANELASMSWKVGSLYYNYYLIGSMEETIKEVVNHFFEQHSKIHIQMNIDQITHFEAIKDNIFPKLVSVSKNQTLLLYTPYKQVEGTDLAVVFQISDVKGVGEYYVRIQNELFEQWNVEMESLYQIAVSNAQMRCPFLFQGMGEILMQNSMNDSVFHQNAEMEFMNEGSLPETLDENEFMYVLSTKNRINGAIAILYPNLLQQISERFGGNFFMFPSSNDEVILARDNGKISVKEMNSIILTINQEEVAQEDVLSDFALYYNSKEQILSTAIESEHIQNYDMDQISDLLYQEDSEDEDLER